VKPSGELVRVGEHGHELTVQSEHEERPAAWFLFWDAGRVAQLALDAVSMATGAELVAEHSAPLKVSAS